jgi:hypothetical protein
VTLWGGFSVAYLGAEDGSSGLSPVGYVQAAFFAPGTGILRAAGGPLGNRDLPAAVAISWACYVAVAVLIAHVVARRRTVANGQPSQGRGRSEPR